ncbi:MAG: pilus assembly protein [Chloroflexaceae bacterium]|nr:pilus assembly protein [Chloroflexaceae bacterium]
MDDNTVLQQRRGQSLVEMALIAPLLFIILFGIIDMAHYIYGFSSIYQAARNGAEMASKQPPFPNKVAPISTDDHCVRQILNAVQEDVPLFPDLTRNYTEHVSIAYPQESGDGFGRAMGKPVQVSITYTIEPLTPLWQLVPVIGNDLGRMKVHVETERTIVSLGIYVPPDDDGDPSNDDAVLEPCQP